MVSSGPPRVVKFPTTQPANSLEGMSGPLPAHSSPPLPRASRREVFLWLIHRRWRLSVRGPSMLPGLRAGDEVLLNPTAYLRKAPRVGEIVLVSHPRSGEPILKRIARIELGGLFLTGDNAAQSTDSRSWGLFTPETVQGRVTSIYKRA